MLSFNKLTELLKNDKIKNELIKKKFYKYTVIKNPENNINITLIPKGATIYQGTDYNFKIKINSSNKTNKSHSDSNVSQKIYKFNKDDYDIDDFYSYYNKRNKGAYFVSSFKTANMYGLKKNLSNIVYTSIIDLNNKEKSSTKLNEKYLYPLYYIPIKGSTIKYKINKPVYLLNIGDIQNIKTIYNIIDTSPLVKDEDDRAFFKANLYASCCNTIRTDEYEDFYDIKECPEITNRLSVDISDKALLEIFKDIIIPTFKSKGININGWIFYTTKDQFHDEMLLDSNEYLTFENIFTTKVNKNTYKDIPSIDEFKASLEHKKVVYDKISEQNNIILSYNSKK
jgi:hypothetical protein